MNLTVLLTNILNLINGYIIPLLVAIAIIVFFWGIVRYIMGAGGEDKQSAVKLITSGIIGLVVMLSVWGIVALVSNTLGISGTQAVSLPQVP
ncbi:MAG: hypothetical protein KGJ34_02505 [Patescibacteria group bacterium]|nr:hypothetical protein [Patescibacteria group bacterium]